MNKKYCGWWWQLVEEFDPYTGCCVACAGFSREQTTVCVIRAIRELADGRLGTQSSFDIHSPKALGAIDASRTQSSRIDVHANFVACYHRRRDFIGSKYSTAPHGTTSQPTKRDTLLGQLKSSNKTWGMFA